MKKSRASLAKRQQARRPFVLRILLTSNASYLPPRGGSTRSNLAYIRVLVEQRHQVRVISAAPETATEAQRKAVARELEEQQLDASVLQDGIEIVSVPDLVRNSQVLGSHIEEYKADWVLVSSEDVSHSLLRQAACSAQERLVYLAHTPQWFPFGPASWHPDKNATETLKQAAGIVVISEAMATYTERHLGRRPTVIHPPMYGKEGAEPTRSDAGYIAMVNPCAVKGLPLFLQIADVLPELSFAVLPGWGTTTPDLELIAKRPNITVLPRVQRIEQFLAQVKILLVPSLWLEGFGLIALESMCNGVPVIVSDSGGLVEAKMGTTGVVPTSLIESYTSEFDERLMPVPVLPSLDPQPWIQLILEIQDRALWHQQSTNQRDLAAMFVNNLDRFAIEKYLTQLQPSRSSRPSAKVPQLLDSAKQELLLRRLKAKQSSHPS